MSGCTARVRRVVEKLLEIVVVGKPEPQGSVKVWVPQHPKTKQPYRTAGGAIVANVESDNPALKAWREIVGYTANLQWRSREPVEESVVVEMVAWLYRRQGDWGTGRNAHLLKDHAHAWPRGAPDADKLLRAVFDALTGIVWKDDSLVQRATVEKRFAVPSEDSDELRAEIRVYLHDTQVAGQLPLDERVRRSVPAVGGGEQTLALVL